MQWHLNNVWIGQDFCKGNNASSLTGSLCLPQGHMVTSPDHALLDCPVYLLLFANRVVNAIEFWIHNKRPVGPVRLQGHEHPLVVLDIVKCSWTKHRFGPRP